MRAARRMLPPPSVRHDDADRRPPRHPASDRLISAALVVLALAAAAAAADRVVLGDGRTIVGEIVSAEDGRFVVRTAEGDQVVHACDVRRIESIDEERPAADGTTDADATGDADERPRRPVLVARRRSPDVAPEDAVSSSVRARGSAQTGSGGGGVSTLSPAQVRALRADLVRRAETDPEAAAVLAVLRRMESEDPAARRAAMDEIVAQWPQSRATLGAVLLLGCDDARLCGTRVLRVRGLGDTSDLCRRALHDASPCVRIQALRAAYDKRLTKLEPDVLAILAGNAPWAIRQDASRTLERIGGTASFPTAVQVWVAEQDPTRKRRLKRLMIRLAGGDLGDDPDLWHAAVSRSFVGGIELGTGTQREGAGAESAGDEPSGGDERPAEEPRDD